MAVRVKFSDSSYTIEDALEVARIAHDSLTPKDASAGTPLQAMATPTIPPAMDSVLIQQMLDAAMSKMTEGLAVGSAAMEDRMMATIQQATGPYGTKFSCPLPACQGAMHRWGDCPYKAACGHCSKEGHHMEGCYDKYPHLSHFRTPTKGYQVRDRSPERARANGADTRGRDRDRDRGQARGPGGKGTYLGKRLNDKGRP